MPAAEPTMDTRIAVLEVGLEGQPTTVAVLADKVYEVTQLDENAPEPPLPSPDAVRAALPIAGDAERSITHKFSSDHGSQRDVGEA
jgi:hypothetical protein